jgi:hypothetical protein
MRRPRTTIHCLLVYVLLPPALQVYFFHAHPQFAATPGEEAKARGFRDLIQRSFAGDERVEVRFMECKKGRVECDLSVYVVVAA